MSKLIFIRGSVFPTRIRQPSATPTQTHAKRWPLGAGASRYARPTDTTHQTQRAAWRRRVCRRLSHPLDSTRSASAPRITLYPACCFAVFTVLWTQWLPAARELSLVLMGDGVHARLPSRVCFSLGPMWLRVRGRFDGPEWTRLSWRA